MHVYVLSLGMPIKKDICLDPSEPDCEAPEPSRQPSHCSSAAIKWDGHYLLILRIFFHPTLCQTCWACDHKITKVAKTIIKTTTLWRLLQERTIMENSPRVSNCGDLHEWAVVVTSMSEPLWWPPWVSHCGELSTSEPLWWALHEWAIVVTSMSEPLWWALHEWAVVVTSMSEPLWWPPWDDLHEWAVVVSSP